MLIVLVSGFGFSYLLRRKRFQPVGPEDSLDQRRQRLLVEIVQLDDDFEDGKISEEVYRRMRSERKVQLVELIQRSEEESVIDNGGKVIFLDVLSFQLAAITASATVGFVTVGTLFLALAVNTKAREIVLPILFFPIVAPVIIAAVKATGLVLTEEPEIAYPPYYR